MGYDRYPHGTQPGDYYNSQGMDYGRDYASGRQNYSSTRKYEAADELDGDDHGRRAMGHGGNRDPEPYRGSYASDGRRFENTGSDRGLTNDRSDRSRRYGQVQGRDNDRGFVDRASDEVMSWFGDEEAERRREADARHHNRYNNARDGDYHQWRQAQIDALDRDYDEYRAENQTKFHNEFASWRTGRQGQRDTLTQVEEHAEVVGSDGDHVGTVDKVRGDRILLTKNDKDAGGIHHSIPSRWIDRVDGDKVVLTRTAEDAKQAWRDEERNQAMFGWNDNVRDDGRDRDNDRSRDRNATRTG